MTNPSSSTTQLQGLQDAYLHGEVRARAIRSPEDASALALQIVDIQRPTAQGQDGQIRARLLAAALLATAVSRPPLTWASGYLRLTYSLLAAGPDVLLAALRGNPHEKVRDQIAGIDALHLSWDDLHAHAALALQELRALDPEISLRRTAVPFSKLSALNAGISPA